MTDLRLRRPTDDDTDMIVDLLRLGLGEGTAPRTRAFWTWKHLASPFGPSYLLIAESGPTLVGVRAFLRWTWWSAGTPVAAVRAVDTVTHPAWQGRGVFRRLTTAMVEQVEAEGAAFVFNTPGKASRSGYLRMGWRRVGRLTPWLRLRPGRGPERREGESLGPAPAVELLEAAGLDAFLARLPDDDPRLTTRVDRAYLAWRYAEVPGIRYHAAWDLEGEEPAAVVFRLVPRRSRLELRVCEVLALPRGPSARRARRLIAASARAAGAGVVTMLAPAGTAARRVARMGGYAPLPRIGHLLVARPLAGGIPVDPLRPASWRASAGAMELF